MTAPMIITALIGIACLIWAALALDRWRFRRYRARRDQQSNAAWRPTRTDEDQGMPK